MIMMNDSAVQAPPAAMTWPVTPARVVKDQHTDLYERHARPARSFTDHYQSFMDVEYEAHADDRTRVSFMFHPVHHKDPERGMKLASYIKAGLREARTYQVTAEMVDAVNGMYKATMNRVNHLEASDLVSPAGFAWLDKPWQHTDMRGKHVAVRAVSWAPATITWASGNVTDATRVCQWTFNGDYDDYRDGTDASQELAYQSLYKEMGDLVLMHIYVVGHGIRFLTVRDDGTTAEVPEEGDILIERPNGADDAQSWLHALWMLLDAEITATTRAPLDRSARRRAQRSLRYDDVQVITLRRARHSERPEGYEPVAVDWSCRWIVQGHWRHNEGYTVPHHHFVPSHHRGGEHVICQTCFGRGAWVRPYVKGPDNKPMRQVDQVWRLSR